MDASQYRAAVLAALRSQPNLDVFDGKPVYRSDGDGRTHIAATLHMGVGASDELHEALSGARPLLGMAFQVTAAGGDVERCLLAARKVRAALTDQIFGTAGFCREDGGRAFPVEDRSKTPSIWYLPIPYRVDIP